jgi:hypothetical protein
MKELNLLREFSRDTSDLVASWSKAVTPEAPQAPVAPEAVVPASVPQVVEEVEVCDNSHSLLEIEPADHLQSGGGVAQAKVKSKDVGIKEVGKTFVAERSKRRNVPAVATLPGDRSADIDLIELRNQIRRVTDLKVMIMADSDGEARIAIPSNLEIRVPKARPYRHVVKPEERELWKSLNRSFNLRSAG